MVESLMMSAKLATIRLFEIKRTSNKDYYAIISLYDITNKLLSNDSNLTLVTLAFL